MLGLLLFIVLINEVGFVGQTNNAGELITSRRNMKVANEIHLKYVDDLTLAEAINLPKTLVSVPDSERPLPDMFHSRTGHVLPNEKSSVYKQLVKTMEYADQNEMKINFKKTKVMLFNPCTSIDFMPDLRLDNHELKVVEELKLLGLVIQPDLKWGANTDDMVQKANKRMWIIRRLKNLGAQEKDLVDLYTKQVRSVLELAVPAWHGGINQAERIQIERIQKSAYHIILGDKYESYKLALRALDLEPLQSRRDKLSLNFALKSEKSDKFQKWFKPATYPQDTRQDKLKYCKVNTKHSRFMKSPISFLTNLLNEHYNKRK